MLAYSGRRCGVNLSWRCTAATGQRRLVGVKGGRPCSAGIRSERVEALGAAGRTTWTPVVGLADETSERGRLCSISLVRSSRRQPSTTACPGGDDLPQGGVAAPNCCVAERRSENLGVCQLWKENHRGVKIIPAQIYTGVDIGQPHHPGVDCFSLTVEPEARSHLFHQVCCIRIVCFHRVGNRLSHQACSLIPAFRPQVQQRQPLRLADLQTSEEDPREKNIISR